MKSRILSRRTITGRVVPDGASHVCVPPPLRSLFEKDKLLFAFLLSSKLMMDHHRMNPVELRFLLTGGVAMGDLPIANPDPSWISEKMWSEMCRVSDLSDK